MNESDGVDLLEYWADLGQRVEPPVDSSAVRLALSDLSKVVEQFSKLSMAESSAHSSTCGRPALAHAAAALQSWWMAGPHIMTVASIWGDVEYSVVAVDLVSLSPFELARLCCLVSAARAIDDAASWLFGEPGWAGVTTYTGCVYVPASAWSCADGTDASDAWIRDLAAQLQRYVGSKARSEQWLKARLSADDGDRRGQLPALLACAWLAGKKRPGQRAA